MTTYRKPQGWVPSTQAFGARLALIRHEMRWNLKEAALACGLPQGSWREWELKGRDPRGIQDVVSRISERTGADEYWLLTGKGDLPDPFGGPRKAADGATPDHRLGRVAPVEIQTELPRATAEAVQYVALAESSLPWECSKLQPFGKRSAAA